MRFIYDGVNIFFGKVFKWKSSNDSELTVTCYDQLRYAKAKDVIVIKNMTLDKLIQQMCAKLSLKAGEIETTGYNLPISVEDSSTWLDIIGSKINIVSVYKKVKYRLADEFGSITFKKLSSLKTNLILGDESLAYAYEYESSIEDMYNLIKLGRPNKETGIMETYIEKDSESIAKYGLLLFYETTDSATTVAKIKDDLSKKLYQYNRETTSLTLDCLGDVRIRAGVSFYCLISSMGLAGRYTCKKVTHTYLPVHTMSIELEAYSEVE